MKHVLGLAVLALLLGAAQSGGAAEITVMTQNQYLGADLTPLFSAASYADVNSIALMVLRQIAASRPGERTEALASEILAAEPALVGVQEVVLLACVDDPFSGAGPGQGCDDPSIRDAFGDRLAETLAALDGNYAAPAAVVNLTLPDLPVFIGPFLIWVTVLDRDVILARADVAATPATDVQALCGKPSAQGCNYSVVLPLVVPMPPPSLPALLNIERGFVAVDATVEGKAYRFVNTHLEPYYGLHPASVVQASQAAELIGILQGTPLDRSLILAGDVNSSPAHAALPGVPTPYEQLTTAGFTDTWILRPGGAPGFTCCQQEDLANRHSLLSERIDMIVALESPTAVKHARVVGATTSDKTWPPGRGLWPSDHGAVTAELVYE